MPPKSEHFCPKIGCIYEAKITDSSAMQNLLLKEYVPKDHLGNVHVVVTDRKHSDVSSGTPNNFKADVIVMRDYYPFGMEMGGQGYAAGEYRYGFNGTERDNEMKGSGDSYGTMFRHLDPRIGRWISRDPKPESFESQYCGFENNPIAYSYLLGDSIPTRFVGIGKGELDYHGLSSRAHNMGRTFEHEWIGHGLNKKGDPGNPKYVKVGNAESSVNKFRREMASSD